MTVAAPQEPSATTEAPGSAVPGQEAPSEAFGVTGLGVTPNLNPLHHIQNNPVKVAGAAPPTH